jgi:hypothetical protein
METSRTLPVVTLNEHALGAAPPKLLLDFLLDLPFDLFPV